MQTKLIPGEKIIFRIPYFENYLLHHGEIIKLNNENVVVQYSTIAETHRGFESITHTTEIPKLFVIQK